MIKNPVVGSRLRIVLTRWFIIGGVATVLVLLHGIAWPNFRFSVYLGLALVTAVGLVGTVSSRPLQNLLLSITSIIALLAVLETALGFYTLMQFHFDPQRHRYIDGHSRPTQEHAEFGFGPRDAPATIRAWRNIKDLRIYDVVYTIDSEGRRSTKGDPAGPCSFFFFGDSMIFGYGLQDDETLPQIFSQNLQFRQNVINFAFTRYGPHQVLRALELGDADRVGHGKVAGVYTSWISEHRWRVRGALKYARLGPRYELSPEGRAVYTGQLDRFSSTFKSWPAFRRELIGVFRGSLLFELLYGYPELNDPQEVAYADQLIVAIVASAGAIVRERFGVPLTVIAWADESGRLSPVLDAFRAADVQVINKDELLAGPWTEEYLIPVDGHPSAKANREIAAALVRRVEPACR